MKNKKGVSLIVLLITIIIVIILTAIVILTINETQFFSTANKAVFKNDISLIKEEFEIYKINCFSKDPTFDFKTINANEEEIKDIISITNKKEYYKKFNIIEGILVYIGESDLEKQMCKDLGIPNLSVDISLELISKGVNNILVSINVTGVEQNKITGYNWYLNGVKHNDEITKLQEYKFDELSPNTNYTIKVEALGLDFATSEIEVTTRNYETLTITSNSTALTNQNVTLTANYTGDLLNEDYLIQMSIDGRTWSDLNSLIINENSQVYARLYNKNLNDISATATYDVSNIDKIKPTASINNLSYTKSTGLISFTINSSDNLSLINYSKSKYIVNYSSSATINNFTSSTAITSTQLNVSKTMTTSGQCYLHILLYDNAGNYIIKTINLVEIRTPVNKTFSNTSTGMTGSYQKFIIPTTGTYIIEAAGAGGSNGNGGSLGGRGAYVKGNFNLVKGDTIIILVGQAGSINGSNSSDGSGGGSGGGTFVTKVNSSSSYTLSAYPGSLKVTPLIVAAGGNGGNDSVYQKTKKTGAHGIYTSNSSGNGFTKFLTSPNGTKYERGGNTGTGGYGGGSAADDSNSVGGGWSLGNASSNTGSFSYNSGSSTSGITGHNSGQGYVKLRLID